MTDNPQNNPEIIQSEKEVTETSLEAQYTVNTKTYLENIKLQTGMLDNSVNKDKEDKEDKEKKSENISETYERTTINRNSRKYLEQYESLSESEFQKLFGHKETLKQGPIGNCYLVSSIITLANTPFFDVLMRTSLKRVRFNGGEMGYALKLPFGEPYAREFLFRDSELKNAKIVGDVGYKLLELCYIKNRRPDQKGGNDYAPVTEEEYHQSRGGRMQEVFQKFFGKKNIGFCTFGTTSSRKNKQKLSSLSERAQNTVINTLKNYNAKIGNRFVELITGKGENGDRDTFQVNGKPFYYSHAYALKEVKKDEKGDITSIEIQNPRNDANKAGGTTIALSLQEFMDTFSIMGCGKIKAANFMDEKNDIDNNDYGNSAFQDNFFEEQGRVA